MKHAPNWNLFSSVLIQLVSFYLANSCLTLYFQKGNNEIKSTFKCNYFNMCLRFSKQEYTHYKKSVRGWTRYVELLPFELIETQKEKWGHQDITCRRCPVCRKSLGQLARSQRYRRQCTWSCLCSTRSVCSIELLHFQQFSTVYSLLYTFSFNPVNSGKWPLKLWGVIWPTDSLVLE